ncbi:MAG TPA: hypothetical protein VNT51_00760 [Miltoncostaeaceae bacterium]|nr:hypothetical protein [Miltoncostaeaceae bacterium]
MRTRLAPGPPGVADRTPPPTRLGHCLAKVATSLVTPRVPAASMAVTRHQ